MATQFITVTGKAHWAKVFPEWKDEKGWDNRLEDVGGQYTVDIELDGDSLELLMDSKSQVTDHPKVIVDSNTGNNITVYKFKRLHEKYDSKGNLLEWASGAPQVVDHAGNAWDIEDKGLIGNGSEVEAVVCVYTAGKMVGTRLEKVTVIDHVKAPEKEVA